MYEISSHFSYATIFEMFVITSDITLTPVPTDLGSVITNFKKLRTISFSKVRFCEQVNVF